MELRDSGSVQEEAEKVSSQIMDVMNLKGKVTESGAAILPCSGFDSSEGEVYRARHPWSLYGVPVMEMEKAMGRLREKLPESGWRIVRDGTDGSRAESAQIVADSKNEGFSVDIRLLAEPKGSEHESLIEVTVASSCYRSKGEAATH